MDPYIVALSVAQVLKKHLAHIFSSTCEDGPTSLSVLIQFILIPTPTLSVSAESLSALLYSSLAESTGASERRVDGPLLADIMDLAGLSVGLLHCSTVVVDSAEAILDLSSKSQASKFFKLLIDASRLRKLPLKVYIPFTTLPSVVDKCIKTHILSSSGSVTSAPSFSINLLSVCDNDALADAIMAELLCYDIVFSLETLKAFCSFNLTDLLSFNDHLFASITAATYQPDGQVSSKIAIQRSAEMAYLALIIRTAGSIFSLFNRYLGAHTFIVQSVAEGGYCSLLYHFLTMQSIQQSYMDRWNQSLRSIIEARDLLSLGEDLRLVLKACLDDTIAISKQYSGTQRLALLDCRSVLEKLNDLLSFFRLNPSVKTKSTLGSFIYNQVNNGILGKFLSQDFVRIYLERGSTLFSLLLTVPDKVPDALIRSTLASATIHQSALSILLEVIVGLSVRRISLDALFSVFSEGFLGAYDVSPRSVTQVIAEFKCALAILFSMNIIALTVRSNVLIIDIVV